MSANKIIEGIKDAIAGNIHRVTIDGQIWERAGLAIRPVAWRVYQPPGGWSLFHDEAAAYEVAEKTGAKMQGLYIRNGL